MTPYRFHVGLFFAIALLSSFIGKLNPIRWCVICMLLIESPELRPSYAAETSTATREAKIHTAPIHEIRLYALFKGSPKTSWERKKVKPTDPKK